MIASTRKNSTCPILSKTKDNFAKTTEGFTCSIGQWTISLTEEGRTHVHVQYSLNSLNEHIYVILNRFLYYAIHREDFDFVTVHFLNNKIYNLSPEQCYWLCYWLSLLKGDYLCIGWHFDDTYMSCITCLKVCGYIYVHTY